MDQTPEDPKRHMLAILRDHGAGVGAAYRQPLAPLDDPGSGA